MRGKSILLLVLAALLLSGCGGGDKKAAKGSEPEKKKAPAELSWQIRQLRLTEPCRAGATTTAPVAAPAAAPVPTSTEPAADAGSAAAEGAAPAAPPPTPTGEEPCVQFFATWPEFETGMTRALLQRLNEAVRELATSPSFDERRAGSVDGTARKLIAAWKARIQEKSGPVERWSNQRKVEILYRDPAVLSFRYEEKLSAGGAHDLSTVLYASYSLDRIDRLSMADLFVEGAARQLNELGEKRFRDQRGIAPGRSLADAGFDFPGGVFRLSSNFAVTAEGMVFRYNPYDVGPYTLGETEVLLRTAEIRDLLRPKGPLGSRREGTETPPAAPLPAPAPEPAAPAPQTPLPAAPAEESDTEGG